MGILKINQKIDQMILQLNSPMFLVDDNIHKILGMCSQKTLVNKVASLDLNGQINSQEI